ncbi:MULTISPECIES: pyridoxamine 5'-phosphate oxidase family protein [Thermoactinomyces]|jgi:uncharacterized protein|uniref:Pyridoxamine 5'-phosphate oxidase family protein n=1 Tax=Thermoactinomyces daqus TaxID=1329516 RepID=A0A7W2AI04_9BACL|nr:MULTISPECIES: pyridoxamine 5'-phosphate oxidase family protein [Thermoactinomyces]MBA4542745.1 pyridoxamine 5'-phosphate oxidase family protein [Thermoactinomyces daqus]MBH8598584.1 pyridoxamine 5'-phosphate oxidase family protein [Thermoactinomyces sp. CICC 10523]MBH8604572.1 pyridoxamine 5'-phosphate oxidase family protein [Thermoactinomyces sp. CICC 10522]MBH8606968.1 pyridoxamine 5'-phosphate oxidase family protein [Thermoactinomyces sp. CICC 10521]
MSSQGEHWLQKRFGTEKRANTFYENQMLDHLSPAMQDFLLKQEMMFLATSDRQGNCDMSFRAGKPGFIHIINKKNVIYPEYRGNGVLASLGNMLENPHIGMLFIDFFTHRIGLHINGTAGIIEDEALTRCIPRPIALHLQQTVEKQVEAWVLVKIDEAYIHCSKNIPLLKKVEPAVQANQMSTASGDFFGTKMYKQQMT